MALKTQPNKKERADASRAANAAAPKTKADFRRENKQAAGKAVKYVLVAIGVAAMLLSVTGIACSGIMNQMAAKSEYTLTGGIAATVNGVQITEDTVTEQIMSSRTSMGYEDDADWAAYLAENGMTPESYRESVIDSLVDEVLIDQEQRAANITVTDDEIQAQWDEVVANYGSEDEFVSMLTQIGYTEESYRAAMAESIETEKFQEAVAPVEDPTDEEIVAYMNENLDTYNDARRSSHILITVDSEADDATREEARQKLQGILDQINAGEVTFEDAAKENSDDSSASDGGDVGWDKLTTFVDEYQAALSALETGQVSDIVETEYGYHIIMCTDHFTVDGEVTSVDQIPEDLRQTISDTLKSTASTEAYSAWFDALKESADIQINEMPAEVPYNVELPDATTADEDAAEESTEGSSEGGAGADTASEAPAEE